MLDATEENYLFNTFIINKKKRAIFFYNGTLMWDCKNPLAHHSLHLEDVISVEYDSHTGNNNFDGQEVRTDYNSFTLHYAANTAKGKWKLRSATLYHEEPQEIKLWTSVLQKHLSNIKHRPRKLLLFINPYGGKKDALQIFQKFAKPLFTLAGVNVTVVVSQRPNQIRDCILSLDLSIYDSVACVGGDGTFSEVFNGLVMRACKEQSINIDDINAELPKPKLPVGIIPAGSTNTMAYCLHGTADVETAVLQIIFGNRRGMDLVSVYNETHMLKLYGSVISYGYLGDIILDSEKYRWMGPKRYEYTGFKKFLLNSGYNVEIAFKEENPEERTKCFGDCDICRIKGEEVYSNKNKWKIKKGRYFMISGANISCACTRSPNGLSPYSHIGDGCVDLILVKHTNLINNLRLLIRLSSKNKSVVDLPFVEVFRTKEFCFRALSPQTEDESPIITKFSNWNCDGEIIYDVDLRVKVRCQLLNVFSRGSKYRPELTTMCC